jgi:hypothetical protein
VKSDGGGTGEGGVGSEGALGREGKTLGLPPYKKPVVSFFTGFPSFSPSPNFVGCVNSIF